MKLESSGTFAKFAKPGDKYLGLFVRHDQDIYNQKFDKENDLLTLRGRDGELITVTCTGNLKGICRSNAEAMVGQVITVAWNGVTKDTGKGNPMKVYEVDASPPGPEWSKGAQKPQARPQHRTVQAPQRLQDPDAGDAEGEVLHSQNDDGDIPFDSGSTKRQN